MISLLATLFSLALSQRCPKDTVPPPIPDPNYDSDLYREGLPVCLSHALTGDPEFRRYGGGYRVYSEKPGETYTPCLSSQHALFDDNRNSSYIRYPNSTADASVYFVTQYMHPYAIGIWNYGSGDNDVKESVLESADGPDGPWTLVKSLATAAFYSEYEPQVIVFNNPAIGFKMYWRWTIKSTWGRGESFSAIREITFYVQPTATARPPSETEFSSPGPFYITNRDKVLHQSYRNATTFSSASPPSYPYSMYLQTDVSALFERKNYFAGMMWVASSPSAGIRNWKFEAWDYEIANKEVAPEELCSGTSDAKKRIGVCKINEWPKYLLYLFSTSDTEVQLAGFSILECANFKCPAELSNTWIWNYGTSSQEYIQTVRPLIDERCGYGMVAPSTSILF